MVSWHRTALSERGGLSIRKQDRDVLHVRRTWPRSLNAVLDETRSVPSLRASSSAVTQTPSAQRPRSTP